MNAFKNTDFETRFEDASRILKKYPDRIPVILQKYDEKAPDLDRFKFLASSDTTIMTLLFHIRKRTKLKPNEAIFLSIDGMMCCTTTMVKELYETNKDKDQFLYIYYSTENTFG